MRLSQLGSDMLKYRALRGGSVRTAECYELAYAQFVGFLRERRVDDDVRHFTADNVEAFAAYLAEKGLKGTSITTKLAALSALGTYGMRAKDSRGKRILDHNPADKRVERPKRSRGRDCYLYPDEIRQLLAAEVPANEKLALAFLFDTRLRASAAATARVRDLALEGEAVKVSVREKGDKPRAVVLSATVAERLIASLKVREAGSDETLLLNGAGRPYTRTSLSEMVAKVARHAGVTRVPVRAHLFARHSVASIAGQNGATAFEIAALLGHADTSTAAKYVHGVSGDATRDRVRELLGVS